MSVDRDEEDRFDLRLERTRTGGTVGIRTSCTCHRSGYTVRVTSVSVGTDRSQFSCVDIVYRVRCENELLVRMCRLHGFVPPARRPGDFRPGRFGIS